MDLAPLLATAERAVREVGHRLRETVVKGDGLQVSFKGPTDIVTELDLWSERHLSDAIEKVAPQSVIIGEESAAALVKQCGKTLQELTAKGLCWFIDPIDGTTNFVNRIPHFSISVGAVNNGERVLGVVFDPMRDELFRASLGNGAELNGVKITVSAVSELSHAVIAADFPPEYITTGPFSIETLVGLIKEVRGQRRFGSAVLDLCWVACSRLDGLIFSGMKPWDVTAASLIVEEAGGRCGTLARGGPEAFSPFSGSYLAAGAPLFPKLSSALYGKGEGP